MNSCSEYVASGHPDKTADLIASYLLDEYVKHDPKVRFAMEVQLKDHICNLAGEVTSTWNPANEVTAQMVRDAIRKVGYTAEYASRWPEGATLNADKVIVNNFIGQQSPDIAQGVNRDGWGDQGCFCGVATNEGAFGYMPRDRYLAHTIGKKLYKAAKENKAPIGLDIKVLVSLSEGETVADQIVIAAPMRPENEEKTRAFIQDMVSDELARYGYRLGDIVINGTGAYVVHSSVGDAGVVGRKLAVDFYGLNCPIGGGSPWGKDSTKADLTLNLMARYMSLRNVLEHPEYNKVFTKIGCCIGKSKCLVSMTNESNSIISQEEMMISPSATIAKFGLDGRVRVDMFYHLCNEGLFSYVDQLAIGDVSRC